MWLIVRRQHGPAVNAALASKRVAQSRGFASTSFGNAPVMSRREMQSSLGGTCGTRCRPKPGTKVARRRTQCLVDLRGASIDAERGRFLDCNMQDGMQAPAEVGTSACAVGAHSSAQRSRNRSAIGGPLQAQKRYNSKGTYHTDQCRARSFFSFCMHRRSAASHVHRTAAGKRRISRTRNRSCTGDPEASKPMTRRYASGTAQA